MFSESIFGESIFGISPLVETTALNNIYTQGILNVSDNLDIVSIKSSPYIPTYYHLYLLPKITCTLLKY